MEEAPATEDDATMEEAPAEGTPYEVAKGDTLNEIAKANGLTVKEIADFNNISNPDLIYADTEIKIPTK
jgi:LysM repeat protein